EIVQIGAVKLNKRFKIKKEIDLLVRPQYYRKMHRKVSRITGLKNEDVKKGMTFPEAFKKLSKFCGKDFVFLTWGPDDISMLRDNLRLFSLDEDWIPASFDLQVFYAHQIEGEMRQYALEDAIEKLGEKPFQAHDALCDARSTALVCRHLNMKKGMEDYPFLAGDIVAKPLQTTDIAVTFENRGEALKELSTTPIPCPKCDDFLEPSYPIPQNSHKYLLRTTCSCGKEYLVRFKIYRSEGEKVRVTREIFKMDKPIELFYREKELRHEKQKAAERMKMRRRKLRQRELKKEMAIAK
ncbi:MAG: exonuclease domain-containing protein, partial [Clostridia bacterium]|nr:exonuclease domain-containing protein [Clostridia bacterium]